MRISDWSSDVCSSDLKPDADRRLLGLCIDDGGADRAHEGRDRQAAYRRRDRRPCDTFSGTGAPVRSYRARSDAERADAPLSSTKANNMTTPGKELLLDRKSTRLNSSH